MKSVKSSLLMKYISDYRKSWGQTKILDQLTLLSEYVRTGTKPVGYIDDVPNTTIVDSVVDVTMCGIGMASVIPVQAIEALISEFRGTESWGDIQLVRAIEKLLSFLAQGKVYQNSSCNNLKDTVVDYVSCGLF